MTKKESEIVRLKKYLEIQKYMQKKKEIPVPATTLTYVNALGSESSEAKTTKRVSKASLKSQIKKRTDFQKLAVALFPNQIVFKKIKSKKPSVLSDNV